ncbi:hypothetical protein BJV82DRAFT_391398 [Fennellomyces sp. T-0311]|nr:hypothetical protein BJV82DRAFT_391398 [Fennellomyces sp. T-0311]
MTLATISYIPAQHSSSTSTTSSTSSSRWRKGLALFQRNRNKCWSAMTLAAATEKYVRHKSAEVKCEDLTAREFAQLTGIKIVDATVTSPSLVLNESTTLSTESQNTPNIWDSDFWQNHHHEPPNPRVIMKGRFKIMMGDDDNVATVAPTAQVVEWKRKRSA